MNLTFLKSEIYYTEELWAKIRGASDHRDPEILQTLLKRKCNLFDMLNN